MSLIKVNAIQTAGGLNGLTLNANGQVNVANTIGFADGTVMGSSSGSTMKNRLINGAMVIDQRNAGASITPTTSGTWFGVDRWGFAVSQSSKFSVQQNAGSVTPPAGFKNYLGITSLSGYSVTANDYFGLYQKIEANNISDLVWGAAGAQSVTLSFWVYSSLTGSFGGSLQNDAENWMYSFTYTISQVNTWTYVTVTIPGPTSGTWLTGVNNGMYVWFGLGATGTRVGTAGSWGTQSGAGLQPSGTVSLVATNGATFYITGVQLEKGSTATSFDYRPYGNELNLCQRYYEVIYKDSGIGPVMGAYLNGTNYVAIWCFKQEKRASPTVTLASGASWSGTTPTIYPAVSAAGFNTSAAYWSNATTSAAFLTANAEL